FFSRRRRHTIFSRDWSSDVCSSDLAWAGALAMFVRSAQGEFARVDRRLEAAARTLGRSEWSLFWAVTLPLAWRGVAAGVALAFRSEERRGGQGVRSRTRRESGSVRC